MQDLSVTIIQSSLHWENIEDNLKLFSDKIHAISDSTDLIILPEMFSTGFTMNSSNLAEEMGGPTMKWMCEHAKEKNAVITGSTIIHENGNYFNRLIWMRPNGTYELYDKRHLFRMMNENNYYSAGSNRMVVELNGWRICPLICYDLRFPVWCRNTSPSTPSKGGESQHISRNDYDCLIFIANWPAARSEAWKALLLGRAHENQAYVAGVNRVGEDGNKIKFSGDSVVINPKGTTIAKISSNEEGAETVTLSYSELADFREKFPLAMDADEFELK